MNLDDIIPNKSVTEREIMHVYTYMKFSNNQTLRNRKLNDGSQGWGQVCGQSYSMGTDC